jgi:flagellar hook-length control protein FliK
VKGTENKQPIFNDKDINAPQTGKIITATDQDDQGKWSKLSGDVTARTTQTRNEDISLSAGREQSPLTSNILSMTAKGADFHNEKTTMDTSKSIYQSVLDQVRDSFSIAQNKDNGQVRVTLKPEIMGHLDMQITVRNETVQIMMTVENEKVHQAMNAHIDDLKTALQNQGMKIDKIEVALQYKPDQERTFHQDKANSGFDNPGQNTRHERMLNKELFTGDEHYPKSGQDIIKTQNSMQGVSVFA